MKNNIYGPIGKAECCTVKMIYDATRKHGYKHIGLCKECGCKNVIAASDEPFPKEVAVLIGDVSCSECKPMSIEDYKLIKELREWVLD